VILLDIRGDSELSDDEQLRVVRTITDEALKLMKEGGYKGEKIFVAFLPTGDGFYIVGDDMLSHIWGNMYVLFALSLRNALLKEIQTLPFSCRGVRMSVHYGTTLQFEDIAGHSNFIGAGMNEAARLLAPTNHEEIAAACSEFYGHEDSVVVSETALEKAGPLSALGIRISPSIMLKAKHDKVFLCRFVDLPRERVYHVFSPKV
jgi:class 3 adenylate cyclase